MTGLGKSRCQTNRHQRWNRIYSDIYFCLSAFCSLKKSLLTSKLDITFKFAYTKSDRMIAHSPRSLFLLSFAWLVTGTIFAQSVTIESFTPLSGPIATSVTVTGTNFSTVTSNNTVYFGGTMASVTAASATQLTVE